MRYVVLLLFVAVGVLLLLLARNRYDVANRQLAGLSTVDGTVTSIASNGDLSVKYRVESADYEIVRSLGVNFFPRIRAGDSVPLVVGVARPDSARIRHWSVVYQDVAVTGGFGVVAFAIALGAFVLMGSVPTTAPLRTYTPPAAAVSIDRPMELRNTRQDFSSSLLVAAGVFAAAFLLFRYPYFMWTPWLTYPAAALVFLFAIGLVWAAFYSRSIRIRADSNGIVIVDSDGSRKFGWADVAGLKRETMTQRMRHRPIIRTDHYTYTIEEVAHTFILLDSSGKELLKIDEETPMDPLQDWLLLRAYIPQRTGLQVIETKRESPLGTGQAF